MWNFLSSVVSGFLLLRDFFGYLIPGMFLTGLLLYAGPLGMPDWYTLMAGPVNWVVVVGFVVASYIAGHVLAAVGYQVNNAVGCFSKRDKKMSTAQKTLFLYYQYLYPSLFIEHDRRDTIHTLRLGVTMALITGPTIALITGPWPLLAMQSPRCLIFVILFAAGLFMIYNSADGQKNLDNIKWETLNAAKRMDKTKKVKPYDWNGAGKS